MRICLGRNSPGGPRPREKLFLGGSCLEASGRHSPRFTVTAPGETHQADPRGEAHSGLWVHFKSGGNWGKSAACNVRELGLRSLKRQLSLHFTVTLLTSSLLGGRGGSTALGLFRRGRKQGLDLVVGFVAVSLANLYEACLCLS